MIKASSIIVATELPPAKLSARNQLAGTVTHIEHGAINDEIVITLGAGSAAITIAAIVTSASAKSLGLAPGVAATALFKASSVIVGVTG